jgi:hypothetical protein
MLLGSFTSVAIPGGLFMVKQNDLVQEFHYEKIGDSDMIRHGLDDDTRIDVASRLAMEQQILADHQRLLKEYAKKLNAAKKIRSVYEQDMNKLLGRDGFDKLKRISGTSSRVILNQEFTSESRKSLSDAKLRIQHKKEKEYASLLRKNGAEEKSIIAIQKRYEAKIRRTMDPLMKYRMLPDDSSVYPSIREYTWNSLWYKRSSFNEVLSDGSVVPSYSSNPNWGIINNRLRYKNLNPGDFDHGAGFLKNQIGEVIWAKQGIKLRVEVDMTCKIAEIDVRGRDEFGVSACTLRAGSNLCISVGAKTIMQNLWKLDHTVLWGTAEDVHYTRIGVPRETQKTFGEFNSSGETKYFFFEIPRTGCYIIWVGLQDAYYAYQNDYEIDFTMQNCWHVNELRVHIL